MYEVRWNMTWGGEGGLTTNPIRFGSYEGLEQREKKGENHSTGSTNVYSHQHNLVDENSDIKTEYHHA